MIIIKQARKNEWWQFSKPLKVWQTHRLEEVIPILEELQELMRLQRYYWVGFISYEAAPAFDDALKTQVPSSFPLIWMAQFDKKEKIQLPEPTQKDDLDWSLSMPEEEYLNRFEKLQEYIHRGDTYQVNYSIRQESKFTSSNAYDLFLKMASSAKYGAYIDLPNFSISSASPELFFELENNTIRSKPMKGTIKRGLTQQEDLQLRQMLQNSQKDRSENVMIVDMIRNDLSKIAEIGSVHTPQLFEVEKHPTVWQMTSTVEAKTQAGIVEILRALYPCASITGAPKANTMRIIRQLEDSPRGLYTGSIGLIEPNGNMQFNVAIRTAVVDKKQQCIRYGMGGGITSKSSGKKEWKECLLKTKIIRQKAHNQDFKILETMLLGSSKKIFLREQHLQRMEASAAYFDYPFDANAIHEALDEVQKKAFQSNKKLRLLLSKNGSFELQIHEEKPLDSAPLALSCVIAQHPIDKNNPFYYHKTTVRSIYDEPLAANAAYDDVLLWNEAKAITEFCYGNIVLFDGQNYWTPPANAGLLAGTYRAYLLQKGILKEKIIHLADLPNAQAIYRINSVKRWQVVHLATRDTTTIALHQSPPSLLLNG